jgi:aspartyl-tRNA(Asn)/glutamyl-tRNA(Gln) amidotransferase subunit A
MTANKILNEARELNKKYSLFTSVAKNCNSKKMIVVKDNICTKEFKTTAGSKILKEYLPIFDAEVIRLLKKQNYSILGKTTQDEFGFGSFSTNTKIPPKNPHNSTRSCGGSSGGTAAYVSISKYVDVGIGQSTGGSISCPAAFCGVVGITPTYGLVSRYGLIAYANSFDRIGTMAKSVKKAAELLSIISKKDEKDSTTVKRIKQDYSKIKNINGMRVGVLKDFFELTKEKGIIEEVNKAIKILKKKGVIFEEVRAPMQDLVVPIYYILSTAEASTNLAKLCGLRYGFQDTKEDSEEYGDYFSRIREFGFGKESKRRILLGTFVRMMGVRDSFYIKALMLRKKIIKEYQKLFQKYDALIGPTMPILPPKFSEIKEMGPEKIYSIDALTIPSSLTGIPSISVPCKKVKNLPVGVQIMANHFQERNIISLAYEYEKSKN